MPRYDDLSAPRRRRATRTPRAMQPNPQRHIKAYWVGGAWVVEDQPANPERNSFVICCPFGDWSGFRTFYACLEQEMSNLRPDYFFWIEER